MSTRACIARPIGDEWEGRYHHSDGYPTGLGAELWKLVQSEGRDRAIKTLIDDHPAGWSFILGADWSLPPGFTENLDTRIAESDGTSPRRPHCYCHGDRSEPENLITSRDEKDEALFIEWVYVLGKLGMAVYCSRPTGKTRRRRMKSQQTGKWQSWDESIYGWSYMDTYPWNGPEPDWQAMGESRYPEEMRA